MKLTLLVFAVECAHVAAVVNHSWDGVTTVAQVFPWSNICSHHLRLIISPCRTMRGTSADNSSCLRKARSSLHFLCGMRVHSETSSALPSRTTSRSRARRSSAVSRLSSSERLPRFLRIQPRFEGCRCPLTRRECCEISHVHKLQHPTLVAIAFLSFVAQQST